MVRLGGEDGVGRVEVGGVLEGVVGAVGDYEKRDDEGCDAEIENGHFVFGDGREER